MIKYGVLHCHTENSIKDSTMTVKRMIETAKEIGAPAIALSDHGVLTGIPSFMKEAKAAGIKPILGIELYVKEAGTDDRLHLIVYAKDMIGYKAMMKAVKLSNKRIEKVGTLIFPLVNEEILNECFGPKSAGYGHVYATSACIGGVLAGLNFQNEHQKKKLNDVEKLLKNVQLTKDLLEHNKKLLTDATARYEQAKTLSEKTFKKRWNDLNKKKEQPEYEELAKALREEEELSQKAKDLLPRLRTEKNTISKQITVNKNDLPEKQYIEKKEKELEALSKTVMATRADLIAFMKSEAIRYENLFGKGNFFIEIQYHGMPEEKEFMYALDQIAQELDIKTVAANDAHMATKSDEDILARETINSLRYPENGIDKISEQDKELYLKSDEELLEALKMVLAPERAALAMENVGIITENCNVEFEKNPQHYPVFDKTQDSFELLKKTVEENIPKRFPNGFPTAEYQTRLDYELSVIKQLNVSDYHLIVQDLIGFGRKLGFMPKERYEYLAEHIWDMTFEQIVEYVEKDQSYIGYTVGPGRGSSAGSLVCYVIGITDLDPIKYNLLFERYLNPERVSMPDIDTDYANSYRDLVIAYTYKRYGDDSVCRIITFSESSAKSAIKDVAKAVGATYKKEEEYAALGEVLSGVIPKKPGEVISTYLPVFEDMAKENPAVTEVIKRALAIEGAYNHYGMHAAGVIISDNDNVNDYVPLSWDEKNKQWKCQCDMVEAEEMGLLKMDFLGLKNLNIITEILRLVYERTGRRINPSTDIEEESEVIKAICGTGNTNAIFQLESSGMKDVEKKLQPDKFEDLILLLAAYRPGPMDSIPSMIKTKKGGNAQYRHSALEPILNVTYGSLIYQEQVQQIFRDLAGYSYGRADLVRRAMSKKKESVFLAEKPIFVYGKPEDGICGCVNNGISAEVAEAIFDDMVDFAKYAFNKSHAAAYARVTYILAWLKYYYPLEFMTVALKWAKESQLVNLIAECKENNIEVISPDINLADSDFSIVDGKIMFGLTSIKGIGAVEPILEARKEKLFVDFNDFFLRGHFKKNITENLIKSGAFDSMNKNRKALLMALDIMIPIAEDLKKNIGNVEKTQNVIAVLEKVEKNIADYDANKIFALLKEVGYTNKTLPTVEKQKANLANYEKKVEEIKFQLVDVEIPATIEENMEDKLKAEKALIGVYLSGHPLQAYQKPREVIAIDGLKANEKASVCGVISDFVIRKRKSDGKEMAFFNIEDESGIVQVACFTKAYEEFGELLNDDKVVCISGKVMEEEQYENGSSENDDEDGEQQVTTILKLSVNSVKNMLKREKEICISIPCITEWNDLYECFVKNYVSETAEYKLILHDNLFNEIRETPLHVIPQIREDDVLKSFVM